MISGGDLVAAQESFMEHLQSSPYLKTNECKCEEDLVTALRNRDVAALEVKDKSRLGVFDA